MNLDRPVGPTASSGSPRLAALAVLATAAATAGLAVHPGPALADGPGPSGDRTVLVRSVDGARPTVVPFADEQGTVDDVLDAVLGDDDAATEDDGTTLGDDDATVDDGTSTDGTSDDGAGVGVGQDDDPDAADDPIDAVAIDRRGRAVAGPRSFAASRTAKGSKLRWTGWNAPTAVGRGTIGVRSAGRVHRPLRGTGTVRLSRLVVCGDGTPVYRRAVFAVAHRRAVTVRLPGCSSLR